MDVYELIKTRRSVRAYQNRPIPDDLLERLLEAARWAPSARNLQPWKFVVVRDEQRRRELAKAAHEQLFVGEASAVIAAVTLEPESVMSCEVPTYPIDIAIAVDHLTLAAAAEGLGTCWIGAFRQAQVREILGVPETCKVAILMPMGYPADEPPSERSRKSLDELICYEEFE